MDKFSFQTGERNIEFAIDSCKYIIGNNATIKYEIFNVLNALSENLKSSEYAESLDKYKSFKINENIISKKNFQFIPVTQHFNFKEELKLKTDSLFIHLLSHKLKDIEYSETFMTLSLLFKDFESELNEILNTEHDVELNVALKNLNIKSLIKLLDINLSIDNVPINHSDMSLEQNILTQLNIIYQIAKIDYDKLYIIYLDIPNEIESIIKFLSEIDLANLKCIIQSKNSIPNNLNEIFIANSNHFDLANETLIYEKFTLEIPNCHSIKETRLLIYKYLMNQNTDYNHYLKEILQ